MLLTLAVLCLLVGVVIILNKIITILNLIVKLLTEMQVDVSNTFGNLNSYQAQNRFVLDEIFRQVKAGLDKK